jgi:hypothetical protein
MLFVTPGEYGLATAAPPSVADQPPNIKPALVGAEGNVTEPPDVNVPSLTVLPPFSS